MKIPTKNCSRDSPGLLGVVISPKNRRAARPRISQSMLVLNITYEACMVPLFCYMRRIPFVWDPLQEFAPQKTGARTIYRVSYYTSVYMYDINL